MNHDLEVCNVNRGILLSRHNASRANYRVSPKDNGDHEVKENREANVPNNDFNDFATPLFWGGEVRGACCTDRAIVIAIELHGWIAHHQK